MVNSGWSVTGGGHTFQERGTTNTLGSGLRLDRGGPFAEVWSTQAGGVRLQRCGQLRLEGVNSH